MSKFPMTRRTLFAGVTMAGVMAQLNNGAAQAQHAVPAAAGNGAAGLPRVKVDLVDPPFVHAHEQVATDGPKIVEFELVIEEKKIVLDADGTETIAFTFNGTVPGPLMVVHEGDYVELTLVNPASNELLHNIDFHSSTGALGGGALTQVNPGEKVVLRWKATKPGVFVYHCAPPGMVPWHVVSGMNGAIMVLPRDGLKDGQGNPLRYDRVYYVGEQDFYVPRDENGKFKKYDTAGEAYEDQLKVMRTLTPTHIVFNGRVGALTGDGALTSKVGETVLIIHSQANRDTRPHLIGGHGNYVWATGKFRNPPELDQETWFIPGGTAGAALYTFEQPGVYAYVNHNLIEAFELGAAAHFKVEGQWNDDLMTQVRAPAGV
ncbi:nitrite reductase (NO-forming) [Pseudochelatococcus lubricantis]|uniref:Copper-containing nitrite reductase n=2 Tax=Bacteria TaxID=2 RepID=A0ABX0V3H3_9HYPH|nr:copper-containing nitrite reductase [Pseudochelatococcus lubricantis]NIJ59764.1 nitrite reductase (NO-forming) [Pseudochelatococcus lubricantis]